MATSIWDISLFHILASFVHPGSIAMLTTSAKSWVMNCEPI